jgi:hypothetical protein
MITKDLACEVVNSASLSSYKGNQYMGMLLRRHRVPEEVVEPKPEPVSEEAVAEPAKKTKKSKEE